MNTDKKEYGISVIMPCYNTEQYVEETLKSVLNQSFKDYEIICFAKAMNIPTYIFWMDRQKMRKKVKIKAKINCEEDIHCFC